MTMAGGLFITAAVAWASGFAGIGVWFLCAELAGTTFNLLAQQQFQNDATLAATIGVAGIIFGIILTLVTFREH